MNHRVEQVCLLLNKHVLSQPTTNYNITMLTSNNTQSKSTKGAGALTASVVANQSGKAMIFIAEYGNGNIYEAMVKVNDNIIFNDLYTKYYPVQNDNVYIPIAVINVVSGDTISVTWYDSYSEAQRSIRVIYFA